MAQENIEVVMPQMGEAITEATISVWHKKEGDEVEEGEALLDISTAKVEVDLPAPQSGVLAKILHQEGETVPVDTLIAVMAPPGTDLSNFHYEPNGSENAVREAPEPRQHSEETKEPEAAPEKKSGTPKAEPVEPRKKDDAAPATEQEEQTEADREREREHLMKRRSSPLVRNMAKELKIDLEQVEGTGRHGRITKRDLERYLSEQKDSMGQSAAAQPARPRPRQKRFDGAMKFDTVSGPGDESTLLPPEEVTVPIMRRQIADQMIRSVTNIPQAYTVHEVDFTQLERLRLRYKTTFEAQFNARLTPIVFLIRAVADALMACPYINASWGGDRIILHRNVNIGIAVAIRNGLVVPVIKCVETMSLAGIARAVIQIAQKARDGQLQPKDMEGATFTITSPGQLGATLGIPIVNRPQGGILHFGAIQKVPAVVTGPDGEDCIAVRQRAMLTLGIDHRLIDGWEADKFMVHVKEHLERAEFGLPL